MASAKTKYQPVTRTSKGPFSASALVGVNTAVVGWDVDPSYDRKKLLGFAIRRTTVDPVSKDIVSSFYLSNYKRFECDTDSGEKVSSLNAPFQKFNWNDYTLDPKYAYRFEIFPMTGEPCDLKSQDPLLLDFRPSRPEENNLGVYFNRGVTAAMVYLDRFKGVEPSKVADNAAYIWLSNGLRESLLNFIDAASSGNQLHVAIYEFHDEGVADRLKAAKARGVKIDIVYHSPDLTEKTVKESNHIIDQASLRTVSTPRTNTTISHNKFVVLIKGGKAKALWTGTSNFSEAGFYLQTNMGMVVNNPATAASYEAYFQVIKGDPASARKKQGFTFAQDLVEQVIGISPQKGTPFGDKSGFMFSPVRSQHVVDAAIQLIGEAKSSVLISAPFALDKRIVAALGQNPQDVLEYGLVNSTAKKKIEGLNRFYTLFFTPTKLETYMGRAWDAKAFGSHKIHAKTIVIDPWGPNPAVLLGSANFSEPSCTKNDENAILVRGNKRLAAIVATEFIRMWEHYKSRAFINQINNQTAGENKFLKEDGSWSDTAFRRHVKSYKFRDRLVFSGKV